MSRMKHLLRKLHIGSSVNAHHRLGSENPYPNPNPNHNQVSENPNQVSSSSSSSSPSPSTTTSSTSSGSSTNRNRVTDGGSELRPAGSDDAVDFNFLEEEFQVQLALAISASDPDTREDPESVQIKAAKQISLGCSSSAPDESLAVDYLSLRYWNYNFVNYDEKVMDGFYDVYGIMSNPSLQGKMPLLVDLQATSISDSVDYEVVLVNRTIDSALQQIERRAVSVAMECQVAELGPVMSGLVQKIADLVVESMGGPVGDADDMLRKWTLRSYELRTSLNTIILPLGCLEIGLSRHRALLFKVLADRINLPCRLVKGSYYTGTDEGAVNLIKVDHESEYIIDLMGAPGTLIPAEPSSLLQDSGLHILSSDTIAKTVKDLCLALDEKVNCQFENNGARLEGNSHDPPFNPRIVSSESAETSGVSTQSGGNDVHLSEKYQTARFEHEFGKLLPSLGRLRGGSSGVEETNSPAQQMKVKDVSKYVISAAQNPDFAQKLHAVLLESGASPPPDLFSDINPPRDIVEQKMLGQICFMERTKVIEEPQPGGDNLLFPIGLSPVPFVGVKSFAHFDCENKQNLSAEEMASIACAAEPCQKQLASDLTGGGAQCFQENAGRNTKLSFSSQQCQESVGESMAKQRETANNDPPIASSVNNERINNPMLDDVAEWEIPWEDLQIGERIGLGSYGEVYSADLNGTEVAVKKFLDQDFSGDALEQFRCEIKIMLRLRHPNVVLFMGAVTRPPNLSILTELLPRGSLFRLLHRPNIQLEEKRRLKMALDVAKGMNYLHTSHPTIVHRDLKSPNLLVDKNWVVKVCDFGLSRLKHHTFLSSKSTAGTPEWMAPEVLRNEPSNEKCDVYSFGVILWELATLRMPWSGMNPMQVVGAVGFQNRRLDIPTEVDPMAAQIICDCWQSDPNLRPSFAQLMAPLKHLKHLVVEVA
ncbi:putative serine/threonine-protein kinase SIS8 [Tasmannia lanceolata]|uniref:putative serine/threonine-protein kinase SIS8 n=1 Tax=Tasmannia lanceolata TaxID=3420 RepID=UPI004063BCB3